LHLFIKSLPSLEESIETRIPTSAPTRDLSPLRRVASPPPLIVMIMMMRIVKTRTLPSAPTRDLSLYTARGLTPPHCDDSSIETRIPTSAPTRDLSLLRRVASPPPSLLWL